MSPKFYVHNPVLEHSELLMPGEVCPEPRSILLSYHHSELLRVGEDRPETRSISLSVSATELIANLKAGGKAILRSPRKFESSRHQGHLVLRA